ncbi:hypothetical protein [Dysosmobacter welbionis]|uniref:hypothetical protein n=1 Tax=Dysosmobacter welbionis TaxID=2093857 RepID=UPI0034E3BF09
MLFQVFFGWYIIASNLESSRWDTVWGDNRHTAACDLLRRELLHRRTHAPPEG